MELVLLIVFRNNNLDDYGNLRMITRTSEWETVLCSYNDYARKADHGGVQFCRSFMFSMFGVSLFDFKFLKNIYYEKKYFNAINGYNLDDNQRTVECPKGIYNYKRK